MSAHTPGPWRFGDEFNAHTIRSTCDENGFEGYVATIWGGYHEANARLITAAPDLLAALNALLPMFEEWHSDYPRHIGDKEPSALLAARAAIAKVAGEPTEVEPKLCDFGNLEDFDDAHDDWERRQRYAVVGAMEYNGNTVSYMYSKAKNYGNVLLDCCKLIGGEGHITDRIKALIAERDELKAVAAAPMRASEAGDLRHALEALVSEYYGDESVPLFKLIENARKLLEVAPALPVRDPSKPAEQQGMFHKFDIRRTDGSSEPGGKHHGCRYFVLDLTHDQHAPAAMRAYAADCAATHPLLSANILVEFGKPILGKASVEGWREAVESAALNANHVFSESCDHTKQAIDYMKVFMGAQAPVSEAPKLPNGWVSLSIIFDEDMEYPEEVAYGPPAMMERLGKKLDKYYAHAIAKRDATLRQATAGQHNDGWPIEIYLQAGDEPLGKFSEYDEVSWCDHPQGQSDVRYMRADAVEIGELVSRFLGWPLPDGVCPGVDRPIGTHLLNADQARAMILHVLAPSATATQPIADEEIGKPHDLTIGEAFAAVGGWMNGGKLGYPTFGSMDALKVYTVKMIRSYIDNKEWRESERADSDIAESSCEPKKSDAQLQERILNDPWVQKNSKCLWRTCRWPDCYCPQPLVPPSARIEP